MLPGVSWHCLGPGMARPRCEMCSMRCAIPEKMIMHPCPHSFLLVTKTNIRKELIKALGKYQSSSLGCSSLDENYVAVFDNIVLALCHDLTSRLDRIFVAMLLQYAVIVYDALNEGLFEIYGYDISSRPTTRAEALFVPP